MSSKKKALKKQDIRKMHNRRERGKVHMSKYLHGGNAEKGGQGRVKYCKSVGAYVIDSGRKEGEISYVEYRPGKEKKDLLYISGI